MAVKKKSHQNLETCIQMIEMHATYGYIRRLAIDSDSMAAVRVIKEGCSALHMRLSRTSSWRWKRLGRCQINHVLREANQLADCLAKFGLSPEACSMLFGVLPNFTVLSFHGDLAGLGSLKVFSMVCVLFFAFVGFPL